MKETAHLSSSSLAACVAPDWAEPRGSNESSCSTPGVVDVCNEDDLTAVAALHRATFHPSAGDLTALAEYYRHVFFRNPWRRADFPCLVTRDDARIVNGFLGVIPRPMVLHGRDIWAAVTHRLMVSPGPGAELRAAQLVRRFWMGPHDLWLSDGVNDRGWRLFRAVGGVTLIPYSLHWIRILRPCRYATALLSRSGFRCVPYLGALASPVVDLLTAPATRLSFARVELQGNVVALDVDALLACINMASEHCALRPQYDRQTLQWLLAALSANEHRGRLDGFAVRSRAGELVASCLYYIKPAQVVEVLQIAAQPNVVHEVLAALFRRAWEAGAASVVGRLEPAFLPALSQHHCLLKRGSWALAHSRDPRITCSLLANDVFLSCLEAELWLRSPLDRL
jgi:hypothetical protein